MMYMAYLTYCYRPGLQGGNIVTKVNRVEQYEPRKEERVFRTTAIALNLPIPRYEAVLISGDAHTRPGSDVSTSVGLWTPIPTLQTSSSV